LNSAAIGREIEALEHELSSLRVLVDTDSSSFSALERQVAELRERLAQTQESVRAHEQRLADKQAELAQAKWLERLAAYEEDLGSYRDVRSRVMDASSSLFDALEAYDNETSALRKLVDEMRDAFGSDERVAEVEASLAEEPDELRRSWEALVDAVQWRIKKPAQAEDLSQDLQGLAEERRRTRIMEYFGKSS
jgi:predicted  nucleic acid-binding Zn-ribbon protein